MIGYLCQGDGGTPRPRNDEFAENACGLFGSSGGGRFLGL